MAPPEADALRRALLAAAGRSGRARASARLRLSWSAGQAWSAAVSACPEATVARRRVGAALERRLAAMEARLSGLDALLLLGGGIAWVGPASGGVLALGALPPPPDRLVGAWRTLAPGEAVLALPADVSWHGRLCLLEGLRRRWPWLPRPRALVLRGPPRVAWRTEAGPGLCWPAEGGPIEAWEPDAYDLL